jgi:hypothetical protein
LSGLVFVAIVMVNIILFGASKPHANASSDKVVSFYRSHVEAMHVSAYLLVVSVIVGLYFYNVMRTYLSRVAGSSRFADLAMLGAVIFGLDAVMEAGLQWSLVEMPGRATPGSMQVLNILRNDLILPFQGVGAGLLLLSFAMALRRSDILPTWVTWLSVALGTVAVVGFPIGLANIAAGVWVLVLSIMLFRALPPTEGDLAAPGAAHVAGS